MCVISDKVTSHCLGNDESVAVSQPVEEEMETTAGHETGSETVANTVSSQDEPRQSNESQGK